MRFVLYNLKAKNGHAKEKVDELRETFPEAEFLDVLEFINYKDLFENLEPEDEVMLCGGDGTLNHFANDVLNIEIKNNVYFVSAGTGNDFLNDLNEKEDMILINDYLKELPVVTVNDKDYVFVNGIGYGLDGYCCEKGDEIQAKGTKAANYTSIAIKGLLFLYHPCDAKVTVDGITKTYKKCWICPTMNGRFFGGGMMVAPGQDRMNTERTITNVVMYGKSRIKTLLVFPSIFKGEHVRHKEMVDVRVGTEVVVEFAKPQALQIDGETFKNITGYTVRGYKKVNK